LTSLNTKPTNSFKWLLLKAGKHEPLTRFLLKLFCEDLYKVLREQQQ
jgi:hypothetical protein